MELFLCLVRHLHSLLSGSRDLDKVFSIVSSAAGDLTIAQVDQPPGRDLILVFFVRKDALLDGCIALDPVTLSLQSDSAAYSHALEGLVRIDGYH